MSVSFQSHSIKQDTVPALRRHLTVIRLEAWGSACSSGSAATRGMTGKTTLRAVHEDLVELVHRLKGTLGDQDSPVPGKDEMQELVTEAAVTLIEYKSMARESAMAVGGCRTEMQSKKKEVDDRHLQLQNLMYEKDHLQRTIQSLRDFPMAELTKIEEDEGAPLLPGLTEGGQVRLLPVEEHRLSLERLQEEKGARIQLHEEHVAAQTKRAALSREVDELRAMLGTSLPRQIEELDALCTGIHERIPGLSIAAPFGGFPPEQVQALPRPMYVLLGRLQAYRQAQDPAARRTRVEVFPCGDEQAPLPQCVAALGTEAARLKAKRAQLGPSASSPSTSGEGEGAEEEGGSLILVDQLAIRVEFPPLGPDGGLQENAGDWDVLIFFFAPEGRELLVTAPGRHPQALVNLLPGDTGADPSAAPTSHRAQGTHAGSRRLNRKRAVDTDKISGASTATFRSPPSPRSFLWLQWLGGTSPFPPEFVDLGLAYTSSCILNRLRVRLRSQRSLDGVLESLRKRPGDVPRDASSPRLFPGVEDAGVGRWLVSSFTEVTRSALSGEEPGEGREEGGGKGEDQGDTDPFAEAPCGVLGGEEGEEAGGPDEVQTRNADREGRATVRSTEGGVAWERAGARYFDLALRAQADTKKGGGGRKEKAPEGPELHVAVEITPEYPIRPPRFRLLSPSSLAASTLAAHAPFREAFAHILVEVNVHYEELLMGGSVRDWLFPHQVHKLLFCLEASGAVGGSGSSGGGSERLRWGKDRRRGYSFDTHCALLMPR